MHGTGQAAQLAGLVRPLHGATVAKATVSPLGTLRLELRGPGDDTRPAHRLRIYTIGWRVDTGERAVAGSADPVDILSRTVTVLEGQRLNDTLIESPSLETTWEFETTTLRAFPVYYGDNRDSVYWTAEVPGVGMVVAGPGLTWRIQ